MVAITSWLFLGGHEPAAGLAPEHCAAPRVERRGGVPVIVHDALSLAVSHPGARFEARHDPPPEEATTACSWSWYDGRGGFFLLTVGTQRPAGEASLLRLAQATWHGIAGGGGSEIVSEQAAWAPGDRSARVDGTVRDLLHVAVRLHVLPAPARVDGPPLLVTLVGGTPVALAGDGWRLAPPGLATALEARPAR